MGKISHLLVSILKIQLAQIERSILEAQLFTVYRKDQEEIIILSKRLEVRNSTQEF